MKKIILSAVLISTTIFTACKKEAKTSLDQTETNQLPTTAENSLAKELNLSLVKDRLVFKTDSDYLNVIDNPSIEISRKLIHAISNFTNFKSIASLKSKKSSLKTGDDYFEGMLNEDKIIQIGNYIYRINVETEKVFVIESKFESEYEDLKNENTSNSNIKIYSTNDNVLELVASNTLGKQSSIICSEPGMAGQADGENFISNGRTSRATVDFNRYGIYFSLFARIYPSVGGNEFVFDMDGIYGIVQYKARCAAFNDYRTVSSGNANQSAEQRYNCYQGSKNLYQVWFAFTPRISSTSPLLSRMVQVRVNL